jgi:hypothetical protein
MVALRFIESLDVDAARVVYQQLLASLGTQLMGSGAPPPPASSTATSDRDRRRPTGAPTHRGGPSPGVGPGSGTGAAGVAGAAGAAGAGPRQSGPGAALVSTLASLRRVRTGAGVRGGGVLPPPSASPVNAKPFGGAVGAAGPLWGVPSARAGSGGGGAPPTASPRAVAGAPQVAPAPSRGRAMPPRTASASGPPPSPAVPPSVPGGVAYMTVNVWVCA